MGFFDDRVRAEAGIDGTFPSSAVSGVPRGQGSDDTVGPSRSATDTWLLLRQRPDRCEKWP